MFATRKATTTPFGWRNCPAGAAFWTEEQSRKNFDTVSALVVPGDPAHSRLLFTSTGARGGRQHLSTPVADNSPLRATLDWGNFGAVGRRNRIQKD